MTTYRTSKMINEILDEDAQVSEGTLVYLRMRQKTIFFDYLINLFQEKNQKDKNFTKRRIANRLGKDPAQITRWLSHPSNLTLDTLTDLMFVICGAGLKAEMDRTYADLMNKNYSQMDLLEERIVATKSLGFNPVTSASGVDVLPSYKPSGTATHA